MSENAPAAIAYERAGRVLVVGSFMMDFVVRTPRRPEPGETVMGTDFEVFFGGKGCNQALAAARSGAPTAMVGRVGDDDFGRKFVALLGGDGIDASHVLLDPDHGTGVASPVVVEGGENSIVIVPRANHQVSVADVEAAHDLITSSSVLLLQLELPVETSLVAARIAHGAGVRVVLNPAPAIDDLVRFEGLVDLVIPNESEAELLTGMSVVGGDIDSAAKASSMLHDRLGAAVMITMGADGVLVFDGADVEVIAAHPVVPVDTVGAGDVFAGCVGARLAAGDALPSAARYANAAAALSVTRAGAEPSIPSSAEVVAVLTRAG